MSDSATQLAELYLAESGRLQRRIGRMIGCRTTAADLVHDIFLRLWKRKQDGMDEAAAYLARSARNAAIDHLRSERIRADYMDSTVSEQRFAASPSPYDIVAARDHLRHVDDVIRTLPERSRHIFLLNRIHGRGYKEIAGALGISIGAVEKHMTRALKAIRTRSEDF
jgi:RNA polymerase sigma-70 factor (ECF subfamily)